MLFFQENPCKTICKNKKNRTSPVRNSFYDKKMQWSIRGKRASLPASHTGGGRSCTGIMSAGIMPASLSVEAALVLTLFLFSCLCLIAPMKLFDQQRRIQGALEQAGEELSRYAYVKYSLEKGGGVECGDDIASILSMAYVRQKVMSAVDQRMIRQVSFGGSRLMEDDMICLKMSYRFCPPVSIFGISSFPMEAVCIRRAWTGADGGRCSAGKGTAAGVDPIVYVGRNSTRYHLNSRCHYLYNALQSVAFQQVDGLRNAQGGKYYPCKRCVHGQGGGTVYVMSSGSSYHASADCSAIVAYIRAVKKSTVAHLGACSYCGRD